MKQFVIILVNIFLLLLTNNSGFAQVWNCPPTGVHNIQHPHSCSQYILCINGNGNIRDCAPGTYFDPNAGNCNIAGIANCNPCGDNEPHEVTFVGSTTDCAEYFICAGNEQLHRRCADGLYFNAAINACDAQQNVDCPHTIEEPPAPPPPPPPVDPEITTIECPPSGEPDSLDHIPHPTSCQHYFICVNGQAHLRACSADFVFDVIFERCDLATRGTCLLDYQMTCPPTGVSLHPHPHNCHHYFICADGVQKLRRCAPTMLFDVNLSACNRHDLAICVT